MLTTCGKQYTKTVNRNHYNCNSVADITLLPQSSFSCLDVAYRKIAIELVASNRCQKYKEQINKPRKKTPNYLQIKNKGIKIPWNYFVVSIAVFLAL